MKRLLSFLLLIGWLTQPAAAQEVTVEVGGQATLMNNGRMAITYDLAVSGAFTATNGTTVRFDGAGAQNILGTPSLTLHHLHVDKPGGDLVLGSTLFINGTLTLTSGDVDLNGFGIGLGTTGILAETPRNTVKGTSGTISARRTLNAPTNVNVAGLGAEITSAANLGVTNILRGHAAQSGGGNQGIFRYFDITPATNTGLNATLAFHYDDSELNGAIELALQLFRSIDGGSSWTQQGGTADELANTVTLARIDAFSRWTLAGGGVLPVELVTFEAQVDGPDVLLQWETASETNNAGFEVQHSKFAGANLEKEWQALGFVDGAGTTLEAQGYRYRVEALSPGRHVFRLKQVDFDGSFEYSPQVEVVIELPEAYLLTAPYPNPFNPEARFSLMVKRRQHVDVVVYDALGRQVRTLFRGEMTSEQARSLVFEAGDLPSGLYVIRAVGEAFATTRTVMLIR